MRQLAGLERGRLGRTGKRPTMHNRRSTRSGRIGIVMLMLMFLVVGFSAGLAQQPASTRPAEQHDMRLVGQDDLQGRSAYQPVIHKQGALWIAYVGHHGGQRSNPLTGKAEWSGTSVVDVTDPRAPRYLAHIPGASGQAEAGGAQMVRVCDGADLPRGTAGKTYLLRTLGNLAHEVWDVSNPRDPALLTTVVTGLASTHKNWWECKTGIAYLVSDGRPAGWRT